MKHEMMLWYIYVLTLYCVESKADLQFYDPTDMNSEFFDHLANCVELISEIIESDYKPTVVIDTGNINNERIRYMFTEAVVKPLMQNQIPAVIIHNTPENSMTEDTKKHDYGFVVKYFETCDDITSFDFTGINKETKYLMIVSDTDGKSCIRKLQEIDYNVNKLDITYMFHDASEDQIKIFRFLPRINRRTCQQIDKLKHINTCFNGSLLNRKIFPPKYLNNLHQCPLKVGMSTLYPFSMIKNQESLQMYEPIDEPAGFDIKIIKIIAKYFNATIDLRFITRTTKDNHGNLEFIQLMKNGSLDVCAGGLYRVYGNVVAYSGVYARQAVVWIYSVERDERSWVNLIGKINGFFIFVIFYIVYSIISYLICMFDGDTVSLTKIFLYSWGALIGANFRQKARSVKQRILNVGYLVICIHVSIYISIQMYSFLTIRGPPEILNTNDEIMDSGKPSFLIMELKFFVRDNQYSAFVNRSGDCSNFSDCIAKVLKYNGLTIAYHGIFYNVQSTSAVNGEARILRAAENILTVYNDMLVRKDSPIVVEFGRVMQTLVEAGITERLYSEAIGILLIDKAASANSNMVTNSYSCKSGCCITLKQFAGIFYAWIFGCVSSVIVFILELNFQRIKKPVT